MLVLIPNPNQIAELVKIQKDFIEKVNICGNQSVPSRPIFYQNTPLWIFLPEDKFFLSGNKKTIKNELKEISQGILKVALGNAKIYFSEKLQEVVLGAEAGIKTESGVCSAELIICRSVKAGKEVAPVSLSQEEDVKLPVQLKIFRLAAAEELAPNTWAVNESVWRKINRAQ